MRLYLVQHGEAVPAEDDPDRPLSDKGRQDVQRLASLIARAGVGVRRVLHSPKPRARDTAVLLAQVLGPGGVVEETPQGLAPMDDPGILAGAIAGWEDDDQVMIVGHLPHMGRLLSRLVASDDEAQVAAFTPGSVACLERAGDGGWAIVWMAGPGLIGQ
jgi:phosphohistidine phosphatase